MLLWMAVVLLVSLLAVAGDAFGEESQEPSAFQRGSSSGRPSLDDRRSGAGLLFVFSVAVGLLYGVSGMAAAAVFFWTRASQNEEEAAAASARLNEWTVGVAGQRAEIEGLIQEEGQLDELIHQVEVSAPALLFFRSLLQSRLKYDRLLHRRATDRKAHEAAEAKRAAGDAQSGALRARLQAEEAAMLASVEKRLAEGRRQRAAEVQRAVAEAKQASVVPPVSSPMNSSILSCRSPCRRSAPLSAAVRPPTSRPRSEQKRVDGRVSIVFVE